MEMDPLAVVSRVLMKAADNAQVRGAIPCFPFFFSCPIVRVSLHVSVLAVASVLAAYHHQRHHHLADRVSPLLLLLPCFSVRAGADDRGPEHIAGAGPGA